MSKWISVNDKLPSGDKNIILFDGNEVFCGTISFLSSGNHYWGNQACDGYCYGTYEKGEITHWMELPNPPENENE